MDGTCRFLFNPRSSDASNWGVLAWNPVSSQTANSDDFLIPCDPESRRMRTDPKIGSDRFRLYESDQNALNPLSGYQRKTVDIIWVWWKVTDQIRLAVLQRNWNPSDRIRRTCFDLGMGSMTLNRNITIFRPNQKGGKFWTHRVVEQVKLYRTH